MSSDEMSLISGISGSRNDSEGSGLQEIGKNGKTQEFACPVAPENLMNGMEAVISTEEMNFQAN